MVNFSYLVLIFMVILPNYKHLSAQVCIRRTCNQIITGRKLKYSKALQIIQSEAYLDAADLSFIRRRKRYRRASNSYAGYLDIDDSSSAVTTQAELCAADATSVLSAVDSACSDFASACLSSSGDCKWPNVISGASYTLPSGSYGGALGDCIQYSIEQYNTYCPTLSVQNELVTSSGNVLTTRFDSADVWIDSARLVGLSGAAYIGAVLTVNPQYPLVNTLAVPPGNPLPGTQRGGGLPTGPALALVPAGLVAVATFPPYASPRTFPADSVIFSEEPQILTTRGIGKRSLASHHSWLTSLLQWFGSIANNNRRRYESNHKNVVENFISLLKKVQVTVKRLSHNMKCLRTRLYAKTHTKEVNMLKAISQQDLDAEEMVLTNDEDRADDEVNSIDDCIEGIVEPLYGFRTNVTLIEDQMCFVGKTCSNFTNFPGNEFSSKQTGEEFISDAPPDCRIRLC